MKLRIKSINPEQTLNIGKSIGARLKGGEVFELIADLGSGKTTLVRGIVSAFSDTDLVSSPSFTISNEYSFKDFTIFHLDFFRINDPGILREYLLENLRNKSSATLIEWPNTVSNILPKDKISIKIKVRSEKDRDFSIDFPSKYSYLFNSLKP